MTPSDRSHRSGMPRARRLLAAWTPVLLLVLGCWPCRAAQGAAGQLVLTVVDRKTGQKIPCRMHLKTAAGRPRHPEKVPFWEDHFVVPGEVTLKLPLGDYTFELERGPEYVTRSGYFTINAFADDSKQVDLYRFTDMSADGWWSGDLDVRRPARDIELLMLADDLHVVPLETWWDNQSTWAGKPPPKDLLVRFDGNRFYQLMAGSHARAGGTILFLNLTSPLLLDDAGPEYPPPARFVEQARQQPGAWIDLSRPYWWDLPTLVANRLVDSIEVAHGNLCRSKAIGEETGGKPRDTFRFPGAWGNAQWSQEIYFRLLECGLRIPPSAGSGSGVGPNPVGYNRAYVHVDGELSYDAWWQNLRAGQVVVTNGPLLHPTVRGELPGHVFRAQAGETMEFEIGLTLSTREPISYLEIIKDGRVEHSIRFNEYAKTGKLPPLRFSRSGWFLVRATTDLRSTYRFAMTGPYYVEIGDRPRVSRQSAQFFLDWVMERARQIRLADPAQRREVLEYHRKARDFWQGLVSDANAE